MDRYLKVFGAFVLLATLALPMHSVLNVVTGSVEPPFYVLADFDQGQNKMLFYLVAIIWPTLVLALLRLRGNPRLAIAIRVSEPILLGYSWFVFTFTIFEQLAIGSFVASCAIGVYAIGAVWSDVAAFRNWRKRSRA